MSDPRKKTRHHTLGILFLAMLGLVGYLVVAQFQQKFRDVKVVTLKASRAGLMMDTGAEVKLRGLAVGRVTAIGSDPAGAVLKLSIDHKYLKLIPANVAADIVPPTAFGAKYVELLVPSSPQGSLATDTRVITADRVTVEVNEAFSNLLDLLKSAQPSKVNAALSALADSLDGNGADVGRIFATADTYLMGLNPSLGDLAADIPKAQAVLALYADIAPGLIGLIHNVTVTSTTLTQKRSQLDAVLRQFGATADNVRQLLSSNVDELVSAVSLLDPATRLLAHYSPEIPCTLKGLQVYNREIIPVIGGNQPGIATTTRFHPNQQAYLYPQNLPVVGADNGPDCYDLPSRSPGQANEAHRVFNTGANPYADPVTVNPTNPTDVLAVLLGVGK